MLSITQQSLKNSIILESKKCDQIRRRKEKENGGAQLDMGVGLGEDKRWMKKKWRKKMEGAWKLGWKMN